MDRYEVEVISPETKEELFGEVAEKVLYERKANIHGACVKLLTDNQDFKEEWEDNFKFMNEDIRPHSKIFAIEDGGKLEVLYEPLSKTCIIKNCDYYGWIKSIALAAISDFFEEYHSIHRRYSVHGSAVDCSGHSLIIIGPPGTGKTTLTYGLLQEHEYNYLSDDWIFLRLFENGVVVYSSEKNSYIRDDISEVWKEYSNKINQIKLDKKGRGIADVNTLFNDRVRESSTFISTVLLERNRENPPFRKVTPKEAVEFMVQNDFCNPHQLIRSQRKFLLRKNFFQELFSKGDVYILNTVEKPAESLSRIKDLIK
ncbi:MAG TPA: AAA family ATPase [Methanobacterium sp.]|nr:AAA family ATPase [Methanobacterium sp.]